MTLKQGRHVVMDLSVLGFERPELWVNPEDVIVLPDMILYEMTASNKRERYARAFPTWICKYRDRVGIARQWTDMCERDRSPNKPCANEEIIHPEFTTKIRSMSEEDWKPIFDPALDPIFERTFKNHKQNFVSLTNGIDSMDEGVIDQIRTEVIDKPTKQRVEYLTQLGLIACQSVKLLESVILDRQMRRISAQPWQDALMAHPLRFAIGRFSLLYLWYALFVWNLQNGGKSRDPNDYEDMYYIFTASYTGFLATKDNFLGQTASELFGVECLHKKESGT